MSKLKEKVEEFAEIAKALPENLQVTCFKLLLENYLQGTARPPTQYKSPPQESSQPGPLPTVPTTPPAEGSSKQEDIKPTDVHVKARKFLEKYGLSVDQLNNLYFKEGTELKPLYEDLKTTKTSESQIRVTLLLALQHAILNGDFEAATEAVREECNRRKCYDSSNFANNYNNSKSLFDFAKFTKDTSSVRLSENGRKKLAELITELQ